MVVLYPGLGSYRTEKDKNFPGYDSVWLTFRDEYPQATWTEMSGKAWLASRAIDYLLDPKYKCNVAKNQVSIIGFSRYGKQSIIAAAFDERIKAVVVRSPGSPATCPYRFTSRNTSAETPADFYGPWYLQSLREFTGRENELPIDAHAWYALIAPRKCLIHTALNDSCEPTFAVERAYLEGKKVYSFLKQPENLCLLYRKGQHFPITDEQRSKNLDWLDLSFGRGNAKSEDFKVQLIHNFNWFIKLF